MPISTIKEELGVCSARDRPNKAATLFNPQLRSIIKATLYPN